MNLEPFTVEWVSKLRELSQEFAVLMKYLDSGVCSVPREAWQKSITDLLQELAEMVPLPQNLATTCDEATSKYVAKGAGVDRATAMWALFHRKWSKDVGTEGYNKPEWIELEKLILSFMGGSNYLEQCTQCGRRVPKLPTSGVCLLCVKVPADQVEVLQ